MGIIAGYLAAIFGLSFYVRRRIGPRLWRRVHRLVIIVYVLALAHVLGAGTDATRRDHEGRGRVSLVAIVVIDEDTGEQVYP